MVEIPVSPKDASYIESLDEPWKSIARKAIPDSSGEESVPDAASRVDQLELNVRSQLLQLFFEMDDAPTVLAKVGLYWKTALDLCVHIVHHASKPDADPRYVKMETRKLPILLIEDCLDTLSVEDSKKFWADYVEPSLDHPDQLLGDLLWKSSTVCHLPFLRVCNHFLRVLDTASHSEQGEWKGRILTALAKGFSIADRSALKFWGSYHSLHVAYEDEETFRANNNSNKNDNTNPNSTPSTSPTMDYNLYEAFWSLQSDFTNPNRIRVVEFIPKLKAVLEAMESAASRTIDSKSSSPTSTTPVGTSIRYMTASSLLPTQLATPDFRCCVLSQFLITASHLSAESPPLAKTLTPLLTRAKKLLQADNPEVYHLLWESILAHREEAWRKWKKEKCPVSAFEPKQKPESTVDATATSKSKLHLARPLSSSEAPGEDEYKSLQSGDLLEISQELKRSIPTLEEHMESYIEALDPESGIEAEYHPGNDPLFAWRAMRLFSKHQLSLLKHCRRPADLERITREWYRLQGKDIPGEMAVPEEEDDGDNDDENNANHDDDAAVEKKTDMHEGKEDEDKSKNKVQTSDEEEENDERSESPSGDVMMIENNDEEEAHDEESENLQDNDEEKPSDRLGTIDEKVGESDSEESGGDQDDDTKSNDAQEVALDEAGKKEQGEVGTEVNNENLEDEDGTKFTQESKTESVDEIAPEPKNQLSVSKRFIPPTKRPEPPTVPSREESADEK